MQFDYKIEGRKLVITADSEDQAELKRLRNEDDFNSDDMLYSAFEHLLCNSELQWVSPTETNDLTDAPMLGIVDSEVIINRWAFMDYQVRSPLQDLADEGKAVFIS